jgi:hypothetical protein
MPEWAVGDLLRILVGGLVIGACGALVQGGNTRRRRRMATGLRYGELGSFLQDQIIVVHYSRVQKGLCAACAVMFGVVGFATVVAWSTSDPETRQTGQAVMGVLMLVGALGWYWYHGRMSAYRIEIYGRTISVIPLVGDRQDFDISEIADVRALYGSEGGLTAMSSGSRVLFTVNKICTNYGEFVGALHAARRDLHWPPVLLKAARYIPGYPYA